MTRGRYQEPLVDAPGSQIGKECLSPVNRRDNHSLDSAQIINGDSLRTQLPAGDHPGRSGSPFRHKLFYLRCSQAGPRKGELRDRGMGLVAPPAPYSQQCEAVPVVVLAIRAMPHKATCGAAAGRDYLLGPFFPGVFRH